MPNTVAGQHIHPSSGTQIRFEGQYELKAIGVVYEAYALVDDKRVRIVKGVIAWGLKAIPPRRRVMADIRETIEFIDTDKLKATASEM